MTDPSLSRRERQIMDAVFSLGEATVNQVVTILPDPPTTMAVRRMMHILEEKGFLKRKQDGREVVYGPRQSRISAGRKALQHVINTFYGGALDEALAAHFSAGELPSEKQIERISQLIEQAKKEGK